MSHTIQPARSSGCKQPLTEKRDSFQCVLVLSTIKNLQVFQDASILEHIEHPHQRPDDFLEYIL